jgi:hypothetical protein
VERTLISDFEKRLIRKVITFHDENHRMHLKTRIKSFYSFSTANGQTKIVQGKQVIATLYSQRFGLTRFNGGIVRSKL